MDCTTTYSTYKRTRALSYSTTGRIVFRCPCMNIINPTGFASAFSWAFPDSASSKRVAGTGTSSACLECDHGRLASTTWSSAKVRLTPPRALFWKPLPGWLGVEGGLGAMRSRTERPTTRWLRWRNASLPTATPISSWKDPKETCWFRRSMYMDTLRMRTPAPYGIHGISNLCLHSFAQQIGD